MTTFYGDDRVTDELLKLLQGQINEARDHLVQMDRCSQEIADAREAGEPNDVRMSLRADRKETEQSLCQCVLVAENYLRTIKSHLGIKML